MKTSRRPFRRMAHRAFARTVATRPLVMQKYGQYSMFYTHDGNKNVSELVFFQQANGIAAHYEYAPFGAVTVASRSTPVTGYDFCKYNPFRFSSEYADNALDMLYYNYRSYVPKAGRWMSRDPAFESLNTVVFCQNNTQNLIDVLGLKCTIIIWAGHDYNALKYINKLIEGNIGPGDSDYLGIVSCNRDNTNNEADEAFPGRVIPGIPRDPGILHNDRFENNPNEEELASKGLERAWGAAQDAANELCKNCCSKVTITVKCDSAMKRMTRQLYVWGMNPSVYRTKEGGSYPNFDWCNRKETVKCGEGNGQ